MSLILQEFRGRAFHKIGPILAVLILLPALACTTVPPNLRELGTRLTGSQIRERLAGATVYGRFARYKFIEYTWVALEIFLAILSA